MDFGTIRRTMAKQIPNHVFRGYDLRGVVGTDLDEERVERLGKAYATWLLQRRIYDCVVGYDARTSSPSFAKAMMKGLMESGITVYDIGYSLSQIVYFAAYYFRTRGGVMTTASHNPKDYNGFKFSMGFSETMLSEEIQELRVIAQTGKFTSLPTKGKYVQKDIFPDYKQDLFRHIGPIKKFTVVVDACASTPGLFMPAILREAGCTVIEQNTKPDGNFPVGTPDPTERDVQERLAKRVVSENADIGFTYDADGDRVGIVDNKGTLIWNDVFVSICSIDILDYLPGAKIVYNTLCSKQVDEVIRKNGGIPVMWKTGHSFIKAKVREERAAFGGELSGHFFFVDNFYGHDDGAIGTLRLLAYLTRVNKSLHEVIQLLPKYYSSPEIKIGCPDATKFDIVSHIIGGKIKALYPQAKYVEIDGVRMDTEEQMLIVRASQNGPYITIKFEGKTKDQYDKLKKQVSVFLHEIPEIDFKSGVNTKALE